MSKLNKYIYLGISIVVFLACVFVIQTTPRPLSPERSDGGQALSPKNNPPLLSEGGARGGNPEKVGSVTVSAGDVAIHLEPNTLLYDALVQAKNQGKVEFLGRNYPGLGFFVTDIGSLHSGNGKNLLYYINGKQASVGVSSYTLKEGDVIEWKLE